MRETDAWNANSAAYVESLYRQYARDPHAVGADWGQLFALLRFRPSEPVREDRLAPVLGVYELIHSYRELGHLIANLDPLGHNRTEHPLLALEEFGFREEDLERTVSCASFRGCATAPLRELVEALRQTYCRTIGVQYTDIPEKEQREWLQERMETQRNTPDLGPQDRIRILSLLIQAEDFERFLHEKYPTQKRFSLEGGEAVIPLLAFLIEEAAQLGVDEVVMGMAHRGRLNVLANILRKPVEMILSEFEGTGLPVDVMGDGDVKYHLGYSRDYPARNGRRVHVSLTFNPSHLEMIDPVVEGIVRAKQAAAGDGERSRIVPLLIHGDAAFNGQGIVPETLMLSGLEGYRTGGTVHVLLNNQIGFTTSPSDYRFTPYASDLARMIRVPVFHVNGDDPEAAVHAARLAIGFRQQFKKDVIIDLICYRRRGHNELDDPTFTQPVLYREIAAHPTVRALYEQRLLARREVSAEEVRRIAAEWRELLDAARDYSRDFLPRQQVFVFGGAWKGLTWAGDDWSAKTAVSAETLRQIAAALARVPPGFHIHPRLARIAEDRARMVEEGRGIDWGCAEALAFGSLLLEGKPVRLAGQDSSRGTFGHRHAIWRDTETGEAYVPLNHIAPTQAQIEVVDSPLSEAAALGFEYGMSSADPHRLVCWEAQFGDFANVAQVFIDQFIASGESKWQRLNGIVLLLPHGYEGQGPDHSSARPERFLQLCAEHNMQVCNLTTPAQLFHGLRRQIHRRFRKPLILLSPKSLLRHRLAASGLEEFTRGEFRAVWDDPEVEPERVRRILLCSGRIFYPLLEARRERERADVALVRVEQLYPFPHRELEEVLGRYPGARQVHWVQEEPQNMGAWQFMRDRLPRLLPEDWEFRYTGRAAAASPATAVFKVHEREEAELINAALAPGRGGKRGAPPRAGRG